MTLVQLHQVTRPLITIVVVGTFCAKAAFDTVTPELKEITLLVMTFWFMQRKDDRRATDGPPRA